MTQIKVINKYKSYISGFLVAALLYFILKLSLSLFLLSSLKNFVSEDVKNNIKLRNINFNPFAISVTIKDLKLDNDTALNRLYIDLSFPNFITKKLFISKIEVEGLQMALVKKVDQILINNIKYQHNLENAKQSENNNKSSWDLKVGKLDIINSGFSINQKHKFNISQLEVKNFNFTKDDILFDFMALAAINDSDLDVSGSISNLKSIINFKLSNFDLAILNEFIDKNNVSFGKIKGEVSSQGIISLQDKTTTLDFDLDLKNAFLYSKDLQTINYYIKELKVAKLGLLNNESSLNVKTSSFELKNLLFSIPAAKFKDNNLSKFSKIRISNINFDSDKNSLANKAILKFDHGGFLAFNHYSANKKKVLDIKVKAVDLTQFSSAFEPILKYQISSGKISVDARTFFDEEKITGDVKINLAQINLDDKNEFGKKLQEQSLIPLKTAIYMIKDDDGSINIDLKLKGKKDDPNFDISRMLARGVGSIAISKISTIIATKLAVKFTPMLMSAIPLSPSNIFTFANGAYKIATKARFKDIEFVPLKSDIAESSRSYLQKLIKFLEKNKKAKIHICPQAATVEFSKESENSLKTLKLANDRVDSLKEYFKTENKANILDQIIFCRPKISDSEKTAKAVISI